MLSCISSIEADLERYLAITQRTAVDTSQTSARLVESLRAIDVDVERLLPVIDARRRVDAQQLKAFSASLEAIQAQSTTVIKQRLAAYRQEVPDSPLFSNITLFGPIYFGRLETATTRALAWLMDPSQPHGFDCDIANRLIKLINADAPDVLEVNLSVAEHVASNAARIDVWAEGRWNDQSRSQWLLLLEAKIDAVETKGQLLKYEAAVPTGRDWVGIFLTPDGRPPESSPSGMWHPLSFFRLAADLTVYAGSPQSAGKPGRSFLQLFVAGLLRDVLGHSLPIDRKGANFLLAATMMSGI